MIDSLELINVQQFAHKKIDFSNGINVLVGETGKGKTTIIRALRWVLVNDFDSEAIRKDGSKKTQVSIVKDGAKVTRTKSDSVNRYELERNGKIEKFDSIGRKVPEPILQLFNIPILEIDKEKIILNIQTQLDSHFMLNEKGTFRNKVLNKLTGNNIVDFVIGSFNKDLLKISKENKQLEGEIGDKNVQLESLTKEKETKQRLYLDCRKREKSIQAQQDRYNSGREVLTSLGKVVIQRKEVDTLLGNLKLIPDTEINSLKVEVKEFEDVKKLLIQIKSNKNELNNIKIELEDIEVPDVKGLNNAIESYTNVQEIAQKLIIIANKTLDIGKKESGLKGEIRAKIEEYNGLVAKIPTIKCQKCGADVKEFVAKELEL